MDCPHLSDGVKIDRLFVRHKIQAESIRTVSLEVDDDDHEQLAHVPWKCLECASEKENWMCLNCGKILCGRYVNSHALKHSANPSSSASVDSHHKLCMNTLNQSVFCYQCDDFIVNDTAQLDELRRELQTTTTSAKGPADEEEVQSVSNASGNAEDTNSGSQVAGKVAVSSSSSSSRQPSSSSSSCCSTTTGDSGWAGDELLPQSGPLGRRLRPRKRTISSDSNTQEGSGKSTKDTGGTVTPTSSNSSTGSSTPAKRTKNSAVRRVVGLRNLGNTCFMNSVLQSLSNIQGFSSYFYSLPSQAKQQRKASSKNSSATSPSAYSAVSSTTGSLNGSGGSLFSSSRELEDANVVEELRKVLLNLGQGGDGSKAISPECLFSVIWKVVPQFRGHRQHDAHEFLRYMLDRLHTELQQIASCGVNLPVNGGGSSLGNGECYGGAKRGSIVTDVFGGLLQSEVRCLVCGMQSKKHDPILDLSLDIPDRFFGKEAVVAGGGAGGDEEKPSCHLLDCLSSFTEVEELAETELYYCSSCKCKQKSTKRFWIRRLPNVLCLHIKRFRWNNFFRTKIDLRISFPLKSLDMSQFVLNHGPETRRTSSSNNIYDLAAVIVHHGNGSSCGHYTSYAHNGGTWLHFNDHTVKEVPASTVADCKPYILFYTRRAWKDSLAVTGRNSGSQD